MKGGNITEWQSVVEPLIGVIVGGLIASSTAWWLERQRWKRERQEKLETIRRDAISAALEWIEPMRNAEIKASSLVLGASRGNVDEERFHTEYPYLLGDLKKKDLSADQRAVLPVGVYAGGHEIVRDLEELRILGVQYGQESSVMNKPFAGFQVISESLDNIGKKITELEDDLQTAFKKTFE